MSASAARRGIDRDSLLRESPSLRDVAVAARLLSAEVPAARRSVALLVALGLVEVGATVVVALAGRALLDAATGPSPSAPTWVLVLAVVAAVGAFVAVRARLVVTEAVALGARSRAVRRLATSLHAAGVEDLSAVPMAGLREILMTDVDAAYRFLLTTLNQATVLVFWLVASLAVVAWLSPPLLLLLAALGLVSALALVQGTRRHLGLTGPRFAALARLSQRARDVVEVERVVLARQFGLADLPVRQLMDAHEEYVGVTLRQGRLSATVQSLLVALNSLSFVAVVGLGSALVAGGALGVGGLVAVVFVVGQLLLAVSRLGETSSRAAETATSGRRIAAYWEVAPGGARRRGAGTGRVERLTARDLGFRWSTGEPLLSEVDLVLRRGATTSLTAETGAGKSTLAMLLTGLLPPHAGAVGVETGPVAAPAGDDGVLPGGLAPDDLPPGRVLYVGARPVLVEGSLRDNLLLDESEGGVGDEQVRALVARATAGALAFDVDQVVVGPHGTGLSSGQAQLVQLARAVWRDPDVVVFDEATSALDMGTEARVQEALLGWCRERVTLVVSHRSCPWTEQAEQHLTLAPHRAGGADDGSGAGSDGGRAGRGPGGGALTVVEQPGGQPGRRDAGRDDRDRGRVAS